MLNQTAAASPCRSTARRAPAGLWKGADSVSAPPQGTAALAVAAIVVRVSATSANDRRRIGQRVRSEADRGMAAS